MKSWDDVLADEELILGKHFTAGRGGRDIEFVVLHHNAGNLSIRDCFNVWQTREASAHYQVDAAGRVGQLVHDWDTAWHSGDFVQNQRSIGIEHADVSSSPWLVSEATLDNGAHLVAALCKRYGLGRPAWGVNVFPHSQFAATACPASLQDSQKTAYMGRAVAWFDAMAGKSPAPATASHPASHPVMSGGKLAVDGYWGESTTRALQALLGTRVDGVVSSQAAYWQSKNPGLTSGWEWTWTPDGSQVIAALQKRLGVNTDGLIGQATITALQKRLGTVTDGHVSEQSMCVMKLQENLNNGKVL